MRYFLTAATFIVVFCLLAFTFWVGGLDFTERNITLGYGFFMCWLIAGAASAVMWIFNNE